MVCSLNWLVSRSICRFSGDGFGSWMRMCVTHRMLCVGNILALRKADQVAYVAVVAYSRRTETQRLSHSTGDRRGFDACDLRRLRDVFREIMMQNFEFIRWRMDVVSLRFAFVTGRIEGTVSWTRVRPWPRLRLGVIRNTRYHVYCILMWSFAFSDLVSVATLLGIL